MDWVWSFGGNLLFWLFIVISGWVIQKTRLRAAWLLESGFAWLTIFGLLIVFLYDYFVNGRLILILTPPFTAILIFMCALIWSQKLIWRDQDDQD